VSDNPEKQPPTKKTSEETEGLTRRTFLGAAAGAAASAALAGSVGKALAQNGGQTYYYFNSFGEVVPVSQDLINLGIYPPPLPPGVEPPGQNQDEHHKRVRFDASGKRLHDEIAFGGYAYTNILLIMVDQLRSPRWVPKPGRFDLIHAASPTIRALETQSFSFTNFFVAATACTPSRSTLMTGLYTQQTCLFRTQASSGCEPDLNTTFQTIGTALDQASMDSYWVGKWHLSDPTGILGAKVPSDYGFTGDAGAVNLPFPALQPIPSPNGGGDAGAEGFNPSGFSPTNGGLPPGAGPWGINLYCDAAIADYFITQTARILNSATTPWFAAVSFINPHDINQFPWCYNLGGPTFGAPTSPPANSYAIPLTNGSTGIGTNIQYADTYLPALVNIYNSSNVPTNWNYPDAPTGYGMPLHKPGMQAAFLNYLSDSYGTVDDSSAVGWTTFMNYYFWMLSCVDYQISRVLTQVPSAVIQNSMIIFLSDHGEYGGSHGLHAKEGAIYDEAINVPLYVSFPALRNSTNILAGGGGPYHIPFLCSMVDILPFIYGSALQNDYNWRHNSADNVYYLHGRESIYDAIYGYVDSNTSWTQQRRLSQIPNNGGASMFNNQLYQPYVLTTTDEYLSAQHNGTSVPPHITGFRTVDFTETYQNADNFTVYGGGKLGIYSYWPTLPGVPNSSNINPNFTQPDPTQVVNTQYEYYDYTGSMNYPETGNEWFTNPQNVTYLNAFNNATVQNELNPPSAYTTSQYNVAYQEALLAWAIAAKNTTCSGLKALLLDDDESEPF